MNNGQLATNGMAFTNSNCMVQGSFSKPDMVLDAVRKSGSIDDGVIVITSKHVTGRVAITHNTLIAGAVIDGTGESGIGAVYKLLLLPQARFTFRQALPNEQWHLQQDLNISAAELKNSLAGPSSIGLSRPADDSLTGLPVVVVPQLPVVNAPVSPERVPQHVQESGTVSINNYRRSSVSTEFVVDCNQLLESVEKKQQDSRYIVNRGRKKQRDSVTHLRVVQSESSKQSKSGTGKADPTLAIVAIGLVVVGISVASFFASAFKPKHIATVSTSDFMATAAIREGNGSVSNGTAADTTKSENSMNGYVSANVSSNDKDENRSGLPKIFSIGDASRTPKTHYPSVILPGGGQVNSTPPAATQTSSTAAGSTQTIERVSPESATTVESLIAKSKIVETRNLSFWVNAVKTTPNDAVAREHLAYALLANGQANVSVQQFRALMQLRKPSSQEIERYVDALVVYNEKDLAGQLLSYVVTIDPTREELRTKLNSMQ